MTLPFNYLVCALSFDVAIRSTWSDQRIQLPDVVAALISDAWDEATKEAATLGRHLFPGPMTRLKRWSATKTTLTLDLGPTDYREFVGTNLHHPELAARFGRSALACPLGISVAVLTADERIVVQRRSDSVFEYPGFFHLCGGNVEPADVAGADPPGVLASAQRELEEELGIGTEAIDELTCLGLAENALTLKPELLIEVRVNLGSDDLRSRSNAEFCELEFIAVGANALAEFLIGNHGNTAPSGSACLLCLGRQQFGVRWFERMLAVFG